MKRKFKLFFKNQSIDSPTVYTLERETKMYVFLKEIGKYEPTFILRVSKKMFRVKGIHIKGEFAFDMPTAVLLKEVL